MGVQPLSTSIYHPQTNDLVEQFNGILKHMSHKFALTMSPHWPCSLLLLLFAMRDVPQSPRGFSLFELLYWHQPQGELDHLQ